MWPYRLSLAITTYSSLILGIFVLLQNRKAKINRVFFVFSILVAVFTFFLEKSGFSHAPEQALAYSKLMYIGIIFIPVVYYHLTLLITGTKSKFLYLFYAIAFFFLFLLPNPIFIAGARYFETYKIYSLRPGILYHPFLVSFFGTLFYSLYTALKKYKLSHGLQKIQLGYFIYGSSIGFLGGIIDFLPKYGIFIHPLNTYCNYLIAIYIGLFAYAIIKYRLMDIRIIVRKGLIYSILIAISTGLYLFAIFSIGQIMQFTTGYNPLLIGGLIIFIFVFAFQPLKNKIQEVIDKIFFKSRYEYQNTLKHLSQVAVSVISLDDLLNLITNKVAGIMKLENASVIILNKEKNSYTLKCASYKEGINNAN